MLYDSRRWDVKVAPERQTLLDAANYMEKHGWTRDKIRDILGRVCVEGAILEAVRKCPSSRADAQFLLFNYLKCPPVVWNDTICQNKHEAVAALRKAAHHVV